ncbi:MAG: AAA family ATPase [Pseudomonadales bacterium]|nr:AAA family ATPase [Pseudomonadales bacterium]
MEKLFGEISLCKEAFNRLKYFKEQRPDIYLCASGSNIGLIKRYPIGQAYELTLYPMSFFEFVMAAQLKAVLRNIPKQLSQTTDIAPISIKPAIKIWKPRLNPQWLRQ